MSVEYELRIESPRSIPTMLGVDYQCIREARGIEHPGDHGAYIARVPNTHRFWVPNTPVNSLSAARLIRTPSARFRILMGDEDIRGTGFFVECEKGESVIRLDLKPTGVITVSRRE